MATKNPRGVARPHDGSGGGKGMPGGQRAGKNTQPCKSGGPPSEAGSRTGPGYGKGGGRGKGKGR